MSSTNYLAYYGSVNLHVFEISSSIPPNVPNSASTETPLAWAYSTTYFVRATFSSNGLAEASIITDVKPNSMAFLQLSNVSPWSKWTQIGIFGFNSTAA